MKIRTKEINMTLSRFFNKGLTLAAAMAVSMTLVYVAPQAHAASVPAFYKVQLVQAASQPKTKIRGATFFCAETSCKALEMSAPPKNVCAAVARELGAVSSFQAGKRVFTGEEVAACNSK
jgi:hypothetical protein